MPEIHHRLRVNAPPDAVFRAITSDEALGTWRSSVDVRVIHREEGTSIVWRCFAGPPDWIGTEIGFEVFPHDRQTVIRLRHRSFREANDAMADCSTAWARALMRLKSWIETPEPDDVLIGT